MENHIHIETTVYNKFQLFDYNPLLFKIQNIKSIFTIEKNPEWNCWLSTNEEAEFDPVKDYQNRSSKNVWYFFKSSS